jgi:hypothetical protein
VCTHETQLGRRQLLQQLLALLLLQWVTEHNGSAAGLAAQHPQNTDWRLAAAATRLQ